MPSGKDVGTSATDVAQADVAAMLSFEEAMLAEVQTAPYAQMADHIEGRNSPDLVESATSEDIPIPQQTPDIPLVEPVAFVMPPSAGPEAGPALTKVGQMAEPATGNLFLRRPSSPLEGAKNMAQITGTLSPAAASEGAGLLQASDIIAGEAAFPDVANKTDVRTPSHMIMPSTADNTEWPAGLAPRKPVAVPQQGASPESPSPAQMASPNEQGRQVAQPEGSRPLQGVLQSQPIASPSQAAGHIQSAPAPTNATSGPSKEIAPKLITTDNFGIRNELLTPSNTSAGMPEGRSHPDLMSDARTPTSTASYSSLSGNVTAAPTLLVSQNPSALAQEVDADVAAIIDTSADLVATEIRGAETLTARTEISGHLRTELPRHIALQLAEVAKSMPDRPVELTLRPEELGRLRMTFSGDITAMAVSVNVERPETLDLMRRHIDILAQEMRDIGYGEVSFSFQQSGDGQQDTSGDPTDRTPARGQGRPDDPFINAATPATQLELRTLSGVDIRL